MVGFSQRVSRRSIGKARQRAPDLDGAGARGVRRSEGPALVEALGEGDREGRAEPGRETGHSTSLRRGLPEENTSTL